MFTKPAPIESTTTALATIVGDAFVLHRPEALATYECDACVLVKSPPQWVVLPQSAQQVSRVIQWCNANQVPYIARGAGTGLSGGAIAKHGGVIIGLSRFNQIETVDTHNQRALVGAGVVNGHLNNHLAGTGLFFAPDPSSQSASTIGGNIAENAGGIHCLKYGVTVDHALSLEVVLPNGNIMWTQPTSNPNPPSPHSPHPWAPGPNLTGLLTGSEGMLGVVTRAWVALTPRPKQVWVALVSFAHANHAAACVASLMANGVTPAALEFMDAFTVKAVNEAFDMGFPEGCEAILLVELDGDTDSVAHQQTQARHWFTQHAALAIQEATTEADRTALWQARKKSVAAYGRYYPAFYLHDCVIPRSQLAPVLEKIVAIGNAHNVCVGNVFHAGDGNLHPNILFDPKDAAMVERVLQAGEAMLRVCLDAGGTLSGEHGIGLEKNEYMGWLYSPDDLAAMAQLRCAFDPNNLANPGKVLPSGKGCGENHTQHHTTPMTMDNPLFTQSGAWI